MRPLVGLPAFVSLVSLASLAQAQATLFDVSGAPGISYGQVCDLVGDLDGDGLGEFLVGAWRDDNGTLADAGSVFVYSGATGLLLTTIRGTGSDDHMGFGSSAAGDVDGDGFGDICAAADEANVPGLGGNVGTAKIVSGRDGSVLHAFQGSAAGDLFGWSTAAVGDVDGDGRDDVLISALNDVGPGTPVGAGSLSVLSGRDGSVLHQVFGDVLGGQLGSHVGRVGDVNGDGRADFAGVQGNLARVFSGADGSELWRHGSGPSGGQVSGGFDANGDGFDDYVLGAPSVTTNTGRVQLLSGRDNSVLHEWFGSATGDQLGASVVGAGDLDGDGYGDVAAGLPGFDGAAGGNVGAVRAFSGRTGEVIFTIEGDAPTDRLGLSLGGGRDVNGDGVPDVIAAALASAKAKVVSFVPRGLTPFGTGTPCPASATLLARGVPALGSATFELHAAGVGAAPLLLVGDTPNIAGHLYQRARFHLDFAPPPPAAGVLLALPLPAPDANGALVAPFALPSSPALQGLTFVFQVASLLPRSTCGRPLVTTRALFVTIQ
jgi:hypothetical protein